MHITSLIDFLISLSECLHLGNSDIECWRGLRKEELSPRADGKTPSSTTGHMPNGASISLQRCLHSHVQCYSWQKQGKGINVDAVNRYESIYSYTLGFDQLFLKWSYKVYRRWMNLESRKWVEPGSDSRACILSYVHLSFWFTYVHAPGTEERHGGNWKEEWSRGSWSPMWSDSGEGWACAWVEQAVQGWGVGGEGQPNPPRKYGNTMRKVATFHVKKERKENDKKNICIGKIILRLVLSSGTLVCTLLPPQHSDFWF